MTNHIVPVVLSGGMGTRLWPASRRLQPKQLIPLVDSRTMIHATVDRVHAVTDEHEMLIVTNVDHAEPIHRELIRAGYPDAELILEPMGRNTAPAVATAAHLLLQRRGDVQMLVLPADHVIEDEDAFATAVHHATAAAAAGYLVTFGITPSSPETGYGYIRSGDPIDGNVMRVTEFKEKPDAATAEHYVASGRYLWNSGMFLFTASRYLEELTEHRPDIAKAAEEAFETATYKGPLLVLGDEAFERCPADSIDYAVMEHTTRAGVVPVDPGWSDVGSWNSLWELSDKDDAGNVVSGDVTAVDTHNTYIRGTDRLIAAVGVEGAVIVDTPDAVLVTTLDAAQQVKDVVDELEAGNRQEFETDGTVHRPWGSFRTIDKGPGYRVLHLWVDPGGKTSMKRHDHRSEHWLVVKGVARITTDEAARLVPTRESVYIPPGEIHRLENPGDEVLEVIEVDVGSYVGEDDIKRFMDAYGRAEREG